MQTLDGSSGGSNGLIGKLAEGLQQFIGYEDKNNTTCKITGSGIAPSNMATHRLCDAAIAFTIGVLEGCKKHEDFKKTQNQEHLRTVEKAIDILCRVYGRGVERLMGAVKINDLFTRVKMGERNDVGNFINSVGECFNNTFHNSTFSPPTKLEDLAMTVGRYVEAVFIAAGAKQLIGAHTMVGSRLKELFTKSKADTVTPYNASSLGNEIHQVNIALRLFAAQSSTSPVYSALTAGVNAFLTTLKSSNYKATNYDRLDDPTTEINATHAKIVLGCIPVIFNAICFFYWKCEKTGWKTMTLGGHGYDLDIMWFMYSMGYSSTFLSGSKTGQAVVSGAFAKFADLRALSQQKSFYYDFHAEMSRTLPDKLSGSYNSSDVLRALYYCASYYFTYKHSTISAPTKSPSTIREMLYFLAALPFTPEYGDLEKHIDSLLPRSIPVSMGGSSTSHVLSSANIKGNLPTTSLFATRILGLLQGPGNSKNKKSEPWLHELYCNTDFEFKYAAGSALFNALSNHTYALQFQLYFLYKQCSGKYTESCGWRDCRFGSGINGNNLQSHLCPTIVSCSDKQCDHAGKKQSKINCNHHASNDAKCGSESGQPSPLQAFLTENLQAFTHGLPQSPSHLANHPPGVMCHVPMGFKAEYLRAENTFKGSSIMYTLNYICANGSSPFRKIFDYLLFLTKRTPRTLGDLFGFHWQIVAVTDRTSVLLHIMHNITNVFCGKSEKARLVETLTVMNGSDTAHSSSHNQSADDLMSLYYPKCSGANCGPYLNPITYTTGTIFSRNYASTYLSWVLYLADDFYDWLSELLERFSTISCSAVLCCGLSASVLSACNTGCHSSGASNTCRCPSIVECGGVLPLFYEYGFTMLDPRMLKLGKKTCSAFHSQLYTVINGNPLNALITTIDDFLYLFRFYFFYNQSAFWTIYICLILYTFFFLLDTLHLRSHLKLTSSHMLPPLALLTSGKPLPVTKLTYITQ